MLLPQATCWPYSGALGLAYLTHTTRVTLHSRYQVPSAKQPLIAAKYQCSIGKRGGPAAGLDQLQMAAQGSTLISTGKRDAPSAELSAFP